jgi:hypothetical protein
MNDAKIGIGSKSPFALKFNPKPKRTNLLSQTPALSLLLTHTHSLNARTRKKKRKKYLGW